MDSDLEATNGALLGGANSAALASKESSYPRKRPTYRQSPCLDEEPTAFPLARLIAVTSSLPVVDLSTPTQPHTSSKEPSPFDFSKPRLPVQRPSRSSIVTTAKGKASFSRSASSPNLREDTQSCLPGMSGVPYSPRQKVAMHENQEVIRQSRAPFGTQQSGQFFPSPSPSLAFGTPHRSQVPSSPMSSVGLGTPRPPNLTSILSAEAAFFQSPVRPIVYSSAWEGFYSTLPLGTVPKPAECVKYAPAGQEHLAYIPKDKSTQERSIHGHFFERAISDTGLDVVRCQVAMSKTRRVEGETVEVKEACGYALALKGSPQLRMKHIREVHGPIYRSLLEFRNLQDMVAARAATNNYQQCIGTTTNPEAGYNGVREDVLRTLQQPTRTEQDTFVSFLLSLVTKQGVSFATLVSPVFKGMMALANPSFTIPAVPTLQRILGDQVSYWKMEMVNYLAQTMYRGALTMDTWTNSTGDRKFLGVTLHFMDANYNMKTLAIGMAPMEQSQSADYLCDELGKILVSFSCLFFGALLSYSNVIFLCPFFTEKIVDEWRLRGKLLSITTDGASNMKKCVELFNQRQQERKQKVSWIHCAAHSIQLCINTALGKGQKKAGSAIALLKKCEHVVQFFGGCGAAKKALELEQKDRGQKVYKLSKSNETRWNSRMVMGARVHKLSAEIKGAVDVVSRSLVKTDSDKAKAAKENLLSNQELCELKDVCELLEPAAALTHSLGGSKYPTISSVYPKVHGYALAPPLKPCATNPVLDLHEDLTSQVETRFVVDAIPDATLVAMFFNPGCFDFPLFAVDSPFLIKAKDHAWAALLELAMEVEATTPATPIKAQHSWKDVFGAATKQTPRSRAQAELDMYFEMVIENPTAFAKALDTPHVFWRDLEETFPLMSMLARAYHCVQATSSESERLFSKAGLLLPPKKINLSYSNFFNMLMHNSYEKFIEPCTNQQPTKENTPTPMPNGTAVATTPQ